MTDIVPIESIENQIFTIRGFQVMLDRDLAELYGVENRALKQAVKRNKARFPEDFIFELTDEEIESLVSQSVMPSKKHLGGACLYRTRCSVPLGSFNQHKSHRNQYRNHACLCENEAISYA
ncbi:MAG: ORF6N domain-containing protein [Desulfuromonadales bacterium]|nr:ORF6N domain-containing protein [Desulfuromonadales bacterium]